VELESALLARQFRTTVDELHSALLRIGSDPADDSKLASSRPPPARAVGWRNSTAAERNRQEHGVLQQLAVELGSYYREARRRRRAVDGYATPLDRAEIASFDDMAVRLQSLADDFDAIHDAESANCLRPRWAKFAGCATSF